MRDSAVSQALVRREKSPDRHSRVAILSRSSKKITPDRWLSDIFQKNLSYIIAKSDIPVLQMSRVILSALIQLGKLEIALA